MPGAPGGSGTPGMAGGGDQGGVGEPGTGDWVRITRWKTWVELKSFYTSEEWGERSDPLRMKDTG